MKKALYLPCAVALFYSAQSQADVYIQPDTVVTASRYEQSKDEVIPSVTVISREDILKLQANSILDVLSLQAGVDVARNGGLGTTSSVFLRGTNSNHTLVLINGVRANSNVTSTFAWEHLPVSQIERIEIVRGSRVSYYGADAIGGVINIITRKQDGFYGRYTRGSYDTQSLDLGVGKYSEKGHVSLVLGAQESDGFSATNEASGLFFNPDDDGYENYNANLDGAIQLGNATVGLNLNHVEGNVDFDSFFNVGNSDIQEDMAKLYWNHKFGSEWNSELAVSWNRSELETPVFSNGSESKRRSFDWLINRDFGHHHLGFGLNHRDDEIKISHDLATPLNYDQSIDNSAAFVNWLGDFDKNSVTASVRYDDNEVYGSDTSADLGWAHRFNENTRLSASAGTAFKAPNMIDLFSPLFQTIIFSPELNEFVNFFSYEGNPNLKPEESKNYELGLDTKWGEKQSLEVNLFYYDIENLVNYEGATFKPTNLLESDVQGLELDYNFATDSLSLNVNATFQDTENKQTGEDLLRRPDNKLNINLDKYFNKFSVGGSMRYASKSQDFDAELDSYTVLDLRAAYQFDSHWRAAVKLENVADEEYQVVNGYNTPGSSAYFTIEWQSK